MEDFDSIQSSTVKHSKTDRVQTTETNSTQQVRNEPFDLSEVEVQFDGACKTQTSIDDHNTSNRLPSLGGSDQNGYSLNFRSSHILGGGKKKNLSQGNGGGPVRPSIPNVELAKRIDNLVSSSDQVGTDEGTPRDIYIPGLDDALPPGTGITMKPQDVRIRESDQPVMMKGTVGLFGTCFAMLKVFLGIGILATPQTFQKIGLVGGIIGLCGIGLMNAYTMGLQIAAKIKLNKVINSYSDLGEVALGYKWKVLVDIFMIVSQLGFAIAYLLFIGSQFEQVICYEQGACGLKSLYIFISTLILIPVCWLKSMNFLAYFSIASNFALFFSLFVIVYYCIENRKAHPEVGDDMNYFTPSALPFFFGVAVFDFEGNNIVLNLHASMKEPEKVNWALNRVLVIYVTMIASFSAISYFCYGPDLLDMVTLNLPHDNLTSTLQIFYSFGLLGTYPIQMMPVFQIIEKTSVFTKMKCFGRKKTYIFRTAFVIITAIIAMSVPKFGLFINLVGSVACTALAFIVPVLCYNVAFKGEMSKAKIVGHYMLIVGGCIGGALSLYVSVVNIVLAFSEEEPALKQE